MCTFILCTMCIFALCVLLFCFVYFYFALLFCSICSEIMQSIKNATKYLNTPTWHRRSVDKLSVAAAARRSSKFGGSGAHKLTAAETATRGRRRVLVSSVLTEAVALRLEPLFGLFLELGSIAYYKIFKCQQL